jgi:hypothetical protein
MNAGPASGVVYMNADALLVYSAAALSPWSAVDIQRARLETKGVPGIKKTCALTLREWQKGARRHCSLDCDLSWVIIKSSAKEVLFPQPRGVSIPN